MTQATLNQLLHGILGGSTTIGFFLVLARISPLFILAPMFSSKLLPGPARGIVAVALAIGLTGIATRGQQIPSEPLAVLALLVESFLVGLGFSLIVATVFAAVEMAGWLTDSLSGFSFGSMVDPINGSQGGVITQLYGLIGLVIFIAIGGDAWLLRGLARTFQLVPLTHGPQIASLVGGSLQACGSIFSSAVEVAAPVILAMLITDVAFGMVSKVVPQISVFAVGFPVKIGIGLLVVSASLPFIGSWLSDQIAASVGLALQSLRIG
jgi:flagellar biosynthesis protein FliR